MDAFKPPETFQGFDPCPEIPRHEKPRSRIDGENIVIRKPVSQCIEHIFKGDRGRASGKLHARFRFHFQNNVAVFENGKMAVRLLA